MSEFKTILRSVSGTAAFLFPVIILIVVAVFSYRYFDAKYFYSHSEWAPPILNGVISGVVTAILLLLFSILLKKHVRPGLENLMYKGVRVEGVWNGVLVPYIGVEDIDRDRIRIGLEIVRRRKKERSKVGEPRKKKSANSTDLSASVIENNREQRKVEAEYVPVSDNRKKKDKKKDEGEVLSRRIIIEVAKFTPIEVRAVIHRSGHRIVGEIVEIGGASGVHTYTVCGSFKNLILTGEYENNHSGYIDRGSLSLMLKKNGQEFHGFFASYADIENKIVPFRCVLKRQGIDNDADVEAYNKPVQADNLRGV